MFFHNYFLSYQRNGLKITYPRDTRLVATAGETTLAPALENSEK